jgi:mannose-6-phosphate isomerase-like protein (cupin superfamily)
MPAQVRIVDAADAMIRETHSGGHISRRLVRREHGLSSMSLNITTIHEPFADDAPVGYDGYDQIIYMLSGEAEVEFDGGSHILGPGAALIIPNGCTYKYKVIKSPTEIVAVFAPGRF